MTDVDDAPALFPVREIPPEAALRPLVRYVGGKTWLVPLIRSGFREWLAAAPGRHYVEPFFGGGAVGLFIGWPDTIANDVSPNLIELYRAVQLRPHDVATWLEWYARNHDYYEARDDYNSPVTRTTETRAALLLYLLARCFNGILRVNRKGEFNVPVGDVKIPNDPTADELRAFSVATHQWHWTCQDFEPVVDQARAGDLVFADPPYAGTFTGYTAGGFGAKDQVRLADALRRAVDRGVAVAHTNADTPEIRALYRDRGFMMIPTAESRAVNSDVRGRKRASCLLVLSHPRLIDGIGNAGDDPDLEGP